MSDTPVDLFLFAVLPYVALTVAVLGAWERYRRHPFTYSSLSSQVLENQQHFWGSVPFHIGLLTVLLGHLVAFMVPQWILLWNGRPLRLYLLEWTGFVFGLAALIGLGNLILRRWTNPRIRAVTSVSDKVLLVVLLLQILGGVATALLYPWGSSWGASALAPYLWSLVVLSPDIAWVTAMPWLVKLHILGFFLLLALVPYTRLVHVLVFPLPYYWRKPQVVRWNRKGV